MLPNDTTPILKKPPSGAQNRQRRIAQGGPRRTEKELASRKAWGEKRAKRKYAQKSAMVDSIKLSRGCADCGYKEHPVALQFDHLPGTLKIGTVAQMTYRVPIEALLDEIAKCEVVCANCHRQRTHDRILKAKSAEVANVVKAPL